MEVNPIEYFRIDGLDGMSVSLNATENFILLVTDRFTNYKRASLRI